MSIILSKLNHSFILPVPVPVPVLDLELRIANSGFPDFPLYALP